MRIITSLRENLTFFPSCHHHSGIKISNAPKPRTIEISTTEKDPRAIFCATMDPPQATAAVVNAAYARTGDSEGIDLLATTPLCDSPLTLFSRQKFHHVS